MNRKQVVVVAIGVAAAIAVVGGGYATLSRGDSTTPVTTPKRVGTTTAVERAACKASRGRPSSELAAVASKAPWRMRLGPGESLASTPANVKASRRGRPLVISGRVLAADCATPVAGATVHVWQTNGDGDYGPSRDGDVRCCYLQGTMGTDARGRYQFQTVKPGRYGGPAHIHFQVRDRHGREVTTELLFAGDPELGGQEGAEAIRLTRAGTRQHPYLRGTFDVALPSP
jgi:protocatechuate 3,4-dioxygenase beta subunit